MINIHRIGSATIFEFVQCAKHVATIVVGRSVDSDGVSAETFAAVLHTGVEVALGLASIQAVGDCHVVVGNFDVWVDGLGNAILVWIVPAAQGSPIGVSWIDNGTGRGWRGRSGDGG